MLVWSRQWNAKGLRTPFESRKKETSRHGSHKKRAVAKETTDEKYGGHRRITGYIGRTLA
jgi:hypothetical protein